MDKTEIVERKVEKEKEADVVDKMLVGVNSEKEDDSNNSVNSMREVVFSTLISPPRDMILPPAIPITPPAPAEIPVSTAPVRLDRRERQAGKNAAYLEVIAQRGQA
jgi:hypothetical protein